MVSLQKRKDRCFMKKFKKIIAMSLAVMAAISAMSIPALANDATIIDTQTIVDDNAGIEPLASYPYDNQPLSGKGSFTRSFTVYEDEPNFKIWLINNSYKTGTIENYTVTLKKNGNVIDSFQISDGYEWNGNGYENDGGKAYNADVSAYGVGSYTVTISNNGGTLNGYLTVRRDSVTLYNN